MARGKRHKKGISHIAKVRKVGRKSHKRGGKRAKK